MDQKTMLAIGEQYTYEQGIKAQEQYENMLKHWCAESGSVCYKPNCENCVKPMVWEKQR